MKLVFYGGGGEGDSQELDSLAMTLTQKERPSITYIPACSYWAEVDFKDFVEHYQDFGINRFILFPVDVPFDKILLKEALNSDIIHLSGGNTYYFLKHLRRSGMMPLLKKFVASGGVLTGLSAGGILMTPNIRTAGFPSFDKDHNDENLKNMSSMNLVKFEFFPHYKNSLRYDRELLKHSLKLDHPLYACPDGSGVVVDGNVLKFVGKSYCFFKGKKVLLAPDYSAKTLRL